MKTRGLFVTVIIIFAVLSLHSQVAINTTGADPEECAILDVSSGDKGMLIPRMSITELDNTSSPIADPVPGLLIYNTLDSPEIPVGFYYWAGSEWTQVMGDNNTTIQNLSYQMDYAVELYEDNDFGSPSTISMPFSSSYYGWCLASEGASFGTPAPAIILPADCSSGNPAQIRIGQGGLYSIQFCISFSGTNNSQVEGAIYHTPDGEAIYRTRIRFLRKLASAGDIGSGSANGLIRLGAGDVIDLRFKSTSNGEILNVYNVNLIVNKVSE